MSRCLVKCPTGGGKTLLEAAIISATGLRTLVMVPGKDLKNQLTNEFNRLLPSCYLASNDPKGQPHVLINLPGTLKNVPNDVLRSYPVLIMDEAHHSAAAQPTDVILRQCAPYRFGFSATTKGRSDNRDFVVEGLFGPTIEIVDHGSLVDEGFLPKTRVDIYASGFDSDYVVMEDLLIVNNQRRNARIADVVNTHLCKTDKEVALVLVRRTEHGRILAEMIPGAMYVDGESLPEYRKSVIEEAKAGNVRCIVATQIFAQGIDIPNIVLCVNAAGGKSSILTAQRFGRVTRLYGGQVKRFVDFYDTYTRTLEGHSETRVGIYRDKTSLIHLHGFSHDKQRQLKDEFNL